MSRRVISVATTSMGTLATAVSVVVEFQVFFPWLIPTAVALAVGAVLTYRVPWNRVGWLLLVFGVGGALSGFVQLLSFRANDPITAGWLDAIGYFFNTAIIVYTLSATLLRFPNGGLLTRRWRWAEYLAMLAAAMGAFAALFNGGWGGDVNQAAAESPLRMSTAPLGDVLSTAFFPLLGLALGVAGVSVIVRYRRSTGDERLQMKWLAYAGGFLLATLALAIAVSVAAGELQIALQGWLATLAAIAFAFVPVAIAVAVLKYRLYDIDVVISRTVVLAILAGFITLVYSLVVVGIGNHLIGGDTDDLLFPILATAIVAIAFEPLRHQAQGWADRLVYGQRATPYEVLSDLTERLSHGEQGEGLLARMARRLGDGTGAERASIWLGDEESMMIGASWPADASTPDTVDLSDQNVFPVTHDDVLVGVFEVVKPRGSQLSTSERTLIGDLAGSAGAVLGYQHLNDSLAAKADELAESRIRLVEAQDRERRRLERDLRDGAQQLIVALKVKIGLAKAMAAEHEAEDLERLLDGLGEEAQDALDEVRALAKGIYPPVLESDGLGSAISALVSGSAEDVILRCEGIGRYRTDVEAAIYFEISEALTNAVKHGSGPICVDLVESDGAVSFSVADSGPGFDVAAANGGSGLQNLRDRIDAVGGSLEIESQIGSATTVRGSIPLEPLPV